MVTFTSGRNHSRSGQNDVGETRCKPNAPINVKPGGGGGIFPGVGNFSYT